MMLDEGVYKIGDWIVHVFYGLGEVIGKDRKILEGEELIFFKVETSDSLYWIPISNIDNNRIRPVASKNQFRYALTIIQEPPMKMEENYLQRRKEISHSLLDISLYTKVRMIRDLHGRRAVTKFNSNDHNVLVNITEQFLNEWTLVMDEDREILEAKLNMALKISDDKVLLETSDE